MAEEQSFFSSLTAADIEKIRRSATIRQIGKDELVFAEGDAGDCFYIIDQGSVSVFYEDKGRKKQLCILNSGDYFGEMALLNQDRRAASVATLEDSTFLCLDKDNFIDLTRTNPVLGKKINDVLAQHNEELILRESLCDAMGIRGENLYVSIKGDPSLRETALFRERYQSPIDKVMKELQPKLNDLILNRSVFSLMINFNSGEIRLRTVFDPFREMVHTADKLIDQAYLDRHFMETPYEEKLDLIKGTCRFISESRLYAQLPEHWKSIFAKSRQQWRPLAKEEVESVMSRLIELRSVPDFYLRNIGINLVQDAIRLQFNCDGTHIVSTEDYQGFIKTNFACE
jgi:CRP-like cAMP-binding protein